MRIGRLAMVAGGLLLSGCALVAGEFSFAEGLDASTDASMDGGTIDSGSEDSGLMVDAGVRPDGDVDAGQPPVAPELTHPWLGFHGQRPPELQWAEATGATTYEVQLTHGCAASALDSCGYDAGLTSTFETSETSWVPAGVLQLGDSAPRSRVYVWRVRACSGACSAWSTSRYFVFGARTDFNGDGLADVAIGDRSADTVRVFLGGVAAAPWVISGISSNGGGDDGFGARIAALGDTNGDGYSDFLVAAPSEDYGGQISPGRAYLLLGGPTVPTSASETLSLPTPVNFTGFGGGSEAIGDVNGDGYADIAIGADAVDGTTRPGAAYVYYGGPTGLTGPTLLRSPELATQTKFGTAILGLGDVNGDGLADIAVSAAQARISGERVGKVWVYVGSSEGIVTEPVAELAPPLGTVGQNGRFGGSLALSVSPHRLFVAAGRASPDDAPSESGRIFVYRLDDFSLESQVLPVPPTASERFGSSIFGAGDVDADERGDILIGTPRVRVELVLLDLGGGVADRWRTTSTSLVARAGVGDVDLDGFDDVVMADDAGRSTLFRGGAAGYAEPPRIFEDSGGDFVANQAP